MSEIEELIYKVTVELNEDDLQKAKKKVQELKETAKEAGIKIGVPTTDWSQASGGTRWPEEFAKEKESQKREEKESKRKEEKAAADEMATTSKEKAQSSKSISSTLSSSEQHLSNILDILRKLYRINSKKSENKDLLGADSDDDSKGFKIPKGGVAGFALEAIKTVGGFIIDAVKLAITAAQKLTDMIVDKNARELNLYKLSDQTDMSVKSLYRLKYVSETLGTSLEEVIGSAKNMQRELMFGMSDQKAMTMMAMGVNPFEHLQQIGEDPVAANKKFFQAASQATSHMPKMMQTTMLESLGFSSDLQYAYKKQGNKNIQESADKVSEARGNFAPQEEFINRLATISGALAGVQAALDRQLDNNAKLVDKFVISYADMQANTIRLVGNVIAETTEQLGKASDKIKSFLPDDNGKEKQKENSDNTSGSEKSTSWFNKPSEALSFIGESLGLVDKKETPTKLEQTYLEKGTAELDKQISAGATKSDSKRDLKKGSFPPSKSMITPPYQNNQNTTQAKTGGT